MSERVTCEACGKDLAEGSTICGHCGWDLSTTLARPPRKSLLAQLAAGGWRVVVYGLILLLPTLLLGRFFCNWICPYGTLHQLTRFLFGRRDEKANIEANRFRNLQQLKYVILLAMIVFGILPMFLAMPFQSLLVVFTEKV